MLGLYNTYLIFPILGAVLGAMLWINYFRKIDVLSPIKMTEIMIAFVFGFLTPTLSLWIYYGLDVIGLNFNGKPFDDLIYSILGIGLTEELTKLLVAILVFTILKKSIKEPIDYLVFSGLVALGYSIRENYIYYINYGSQIITGRTLISCLVHIINTNICIYGIYRYQLFQKGNKYYNAFIGVTVAILSHGLFDFFITHEIIGPLTTSLATIVYLIGINFWIQMFNNAINFSPFFNYTKVASISKIYKSILWWYAAILFLEFSYAFYYKNFHYAITHSIFNTFNEGVLLIIVALRVSRLKINKRKYYPIKLQFPIYISKNDDEDIRILGIPIKVRGENLKESRFLKYMGRDILICRVNKHTSIFNSNRRARILKKYYLKNEVVTYLIEVYKEEGENSNQIFLLKPKTIKITSIHKLYPVATLMKYNYAYDFQQDVEDISYKSLKSIELVYLKPYAV